MLQKCIIFQIECSIHCSMHFVFQNYVKIYIKQLKFIVNKSKHQLFEKSTMLPKMVPKMIENDIPNRQKLLLKSIKNAPQKKRKCIQHNQKLYSILSKKNRKNAFQVISLSPLGEPWHPLLGAQTPKMEQDSQNGSKIDQNCAQMMAKWNKQPWRPLGPLTP